MEIGINDDDRRRMQRYTDSSYLDRSPDDLLPGEDE